MLIADDIRLVIAPYKVLLATDRNRGLMRLEVHKGHRNIEVRKTLRVTSYAIRLIVAKGFKPITHTSSSRITLSLPNTIRTAITT
jgi:hypothetical protein